MVNFANFDLNLLRVLDALLRERSTVKAAKRIGLSQPAVSAALSRLRLATGDELLVRQGQQMVPTEYALKLASPLREELERLQKIFDAEAFDPFSCQATFRLSGSDFFADIMMPALIGDMQEQAPSVRVQLVDLVPEDYAATLERYGSVAALVPDGDFPDWIVKREMFVSPFCVISAKDNPLVLDAKLEEGSVFPLDLFCDLKHVLFSVQGNLAAMGDAALAAVGRERMVVATLPAFSGVCSTVAGSRHIALVPYQYAQIFKQKFGLGIYRAPMAIDEPRICMIWERRHDRNEAQMWFRERVAYVLAPLDDMACKWRAGGTTTV